MKITSPSWIRTISGLKAQTVGIETILSDYLDLGLFPEAIALRYPTVSLEAVYATITYYWHNKERIDAYLKDWREYGRADAL